MEENSHDENKNLESFRKTQNKKGGFFGEIIRFTVLAILIVVPFRMFIAQPFVVSGASMYPAFKDGEYLIVDQLSFRFEEPKREDVVIFRYPKNPNTFFIKRIIGLPGETVIVRAGTVIIKNTDNPKGFIVTDKYVAPSNKKYENLEVTLGDGEYFVMGDNRLGSLDSRAWGPVKENLIVGRPFIRLLPLERVGILPGS